MDHIFFRGSNSMCKGFHHGDPVESRRKNFPRRHRIIVVSCLWCNVVTQLHLERRGDLYLEKIFTNDCQAFFVWFECVFFCMYLFFFQHCLYHDFMVWFFVTSSTDFWVLGLMIFFCITLFLDVVLECFFDEQKVYGYIVYDHHPWWKSRKNTGFLWDFKSFGGHHLDHVDMRHVCFPGRKNISRESFFGWNTIGWFFRKPNISRSKIALNIFVLRNIWKWNINIEQCDYL